jgi:hypothetical protein
VPPVITVVDTLLLANGAVRNPPAMPAMLGSADDPAQEHVDGIVGGLRSDRRSGDQLANEDRRGEHVDHDLEVEVVTEFARLVAELPPEAVGLSVKETAITTYHTDGG